MPMMTYFAMHHSLEMPEEWIPWAVVAVIAGMVGCLAFMIGVLIKDRRR